MIKYRVETERSLSEELSTLKEAVDEYDYVKTDRMSEGVNEDSYVRLVSSKDNFETYEIIRYAEAVYDEEKMVKSVPKDEGFTFDYWAKWKEHILV